MLFSETNRRNRLAVIISVLIAVSITGTVQASADEESASPMVVGIHHMERGFRVNKFYLNSGYFGTVGPEGGGGGHVCCITLPRVWRPGLQVEVRWSVGDYRTEKFKAIKKGNWTSVRGEGVFEAQVPIEKYSESPSRLYAHFFSGGRVRIVTDTAESPIKERAGVGESRIAGELATQGKLRDDYFTELERKALDEKRRRELKEQGDWR